MSGEEDAIPAFARRYAQAMIQDLAAFIGETQLAGIVYGAAPGAGSSTTVADILDTIDGDLSTLDSAAEEQHRLRTAHDNVVRDLAAVKADAARWYAALARIAERGLVGVDTREVAADALAADRGLPNGYPPAMREDEIRYVEDHLRAGVPLSPETGMRVLATAVKERRLRKMADERANAAAQREAELRHSIGGRE